MRKTRLNEVQRRALELVADGRCRDFYDFSKVGVLGPTLGFLNKNELLQQEAHGWTITEGGRKALEGGK